MNETGNRMEFTAHISTKDLCVWYGAEQVLKGINIEIPQNRITAIIGPSGCGKSTLLKCFNRLIDESDGARAAGGVFVDGVDVFAPRTDVAAVRRKMGLLLQKPYPLPMSIFENVAYGPRVHGVRGRVRIERIVEEHLKAAGLWDEVKDRLHSPAAALSQGQQQRLCLARGLAVEPEILLCDEPTSALDPHSSRHIERKFQELKEQYTIVVVTHILRQAKRLADHVVFIYMGEVIEQGPAAEVFESPREEMTREYIRGIIS